jgi:ABC-2 type transport system ATP-binding protein
VATTQLESIARPDARVEAIRMSHLSKRFGEGVLAVDDLSLQIDHGMVFGLLGPNGAGKTTVLRMTVGLIHPSAGETFLFGERMHAGSKLLRRVGAIIESPGFVPHLSGMDNLRNYWLSGGDRWSAANLDEALAIADLGSAINRKVRTYSKGMMQRLAIAQVLLNRPQLLILDEPTIGLDPGEMRDIRDLIRKLAERGATVFLSSHILAELEQVCTHAAVMNRGRLVASGTIDELIGASESVYLETDDLARTLAILQTLPGIASIEQEPPGLALKLGEIERRQIVAALVGAGIGVETISSRHRLEDAFIGMVEDDK